MKTAVLTDSTAYIPKSVRDEWKIHMVPLNVIFGSESYQEEVDIDADEFYAKMRETEELPKTSQPSVGYVTEKLKELGEEYDAVVAIHLSSGISGTLQGTIAAGEMAENIEVYAYDSEISAMAQGFYVLEAAKLANEGANPEKIIERLDEIKKTTRAYFMVDDLTNLHKGGRLNSAQAMIGSLLQVKPILHFVDGKIEPYEKIRTRKKALNRIRELFDESASKGIEIVATFIHSQREEEAIKWKEELESKYENVSVTISYFGPVIGTHLGEGALGLTWYEK
ncbi:DegV family protein [Salinibacillus xinjiangensis]|uniref:DegV family EDD domain-containing protein n=1 Tax=Salinibacillus xinjiangensis TaxID=1229268 RepID=A0A6G1X1G9_9BACI|nr:DegV family protein [Salinibacillus xinjiangensis]MRG84792.1 DegV family EDD domain-containing protein [Salinibacillus xinjiangensis]